VENSTPSSVLINSANRYWSCNGTEFLDVMDALGVLNAKEDVNFSTLRAL
jgi:hypothetical protein